MRRAFLPLLGLLTVNLWAAPKAHVILFGKATAADPTVSESGPFSVRPLFVDGKVREYTTGSAHEVTERLFVVQRSVRLNDALPNESKSASHWVWQRGSWLSVDRQTGHISVLALPGFDAATSAVSWYRDYAAYCGASESGEKKYLIVAQLGRRKPLLKKASPAGCHAPVWQRNPSRVTFAAEGMQPASFQIDAHGAEALPVEDDEMKEEPQ